MMSELSPGDLLGKTGELAKALSEAEKNYADARKSREEAEKVRAEAEKVRADTESTRATTQNALSTAQADIEAKQIANVRSRADNEAARIDKLITQATGAVPDIASLPKSTVTFSKGAVLRQGEATAFVLDAVARQVADAIGSVEDRDLYLVSNANLLADIVTYKQIAAEASHLRTLATNAKAEVDLALPLGDRGLAEAPALVLASLAGAVGKQVASLFEVDVAATTDTAEVTAVTVHAAIAAHLLCDRNNKLTVHHEHARVPDFSTGLMDGINQLIQLDIDLASAEARLASEIKTLDEQVVIAEGALAAAEKALKEAKTDEEKRAAKDEVEKAQAPLHEHRARRKDLQVCKIGLTVVVERVRAFITRALTIPPAGVSELAAAIAVEAIAADPKALVLVAGPGRVESSQLVGTRRILVPRIHISVALFVDFFLVEGAKLVAAGHASQAVAFGGKLTRKGMIWSKAQPLELAGSQKLASSGSRPVLESGTHRELPKSTAASPT